MADPVIVLNLDDVNRSLARAGPLIYKASRLGLREAAEPVKRDAGELSRSELSGMNRAKREPPPWSIQKIGQNIHGVYMVPKQKGTRGDPRNPRSRPNFSTLMLGKVYDPAMERNKLKVRIAVDNWLGRVWSDL